jgi:intracellular sulfur oxidation DsrE/DsrF family protein
MKKGTQLFISASIAIIFSLISIAKVHCQEFKVLEGLESINAVVDFRKDNPKEVATYLNLIHQTYKGVNMNINENTDFIIVFTGSVVKLLSTNKDGFPSEEHEIIDNIADIITAMAKDGIKMEICLYATKAFGIESDSILPELDQILNGWLSVIGYQAKHYSLLPIY